MKKTAGLFFVRQTSGHRQKVTRGQTTFSETEAGLFLVRQTSGHRQKVARGQFILSETTIEGRGVGLGK